MSKQKAFTLIELLIVIGIIGIISGIVVIQMNGAINAVNDATKKTDLNTIKKALAIYQAETGNPLPEESGCTIGSCPNLDSALEDFLPDSLSNTYTYSSDGTSYNISSVLSSGYAYQYDSLTNEYSTLEPTNGSCGSSNGANLSSVPINNFCTQGTATTVTGSGPWAWTCIGENGGETASCSANLALNGSCGLADGSNSYTAPSTDLCLAGTASSVSGTGPWAWTCAGTNSGTTANCSAAKKIDGVCGTANKAYSSSSSSYGSDTFCTTGAQSPQTISFPAAGGSSPWTCAGTNSGATANCSATKNVAATCPSGATCSTVSSDYIIKWATVGSYSWTVPNGVSSVQYLVLAGGGGGGCAGAGGGAGGLLSGNLNVSAGTGTTIAVGAGGGGGSGGYDVAYRGSNGGNSSFVHSSTSLIATGGGAGGSFNPTTYPGVNGGSGGGGQIERSATTYGTGGLGTSGQGNNGGASSSTSSSAGGGGGAGGVGGSGAGAVAGNGGIGISSSITGTTTWYAGGGGGGSHNTNTPGTATSGGGNGGNSGGGSSATANTGGGGGGGGLADGGGRYSGGSGGSGIVIVRFVAP